MNDQKMFLQRVNQIILSNIDNRSLKGAFIAQKLGVNRMYLHRKLKQFCNKNAGEYIQSVRIQVAKEMLLDSEKNISEIYATVGFSDLSYFSKTFKKVTGVSPCNYKKYQNEA